MKKLFITAIISLCCNLTAPAGDIFVSATNGNDKASGSKEAPLKTLEQALKQAREWRRLGSSNAEGGISIIMSGGVYRLYKPLFIRPEDSGTANSPTIIRSADGERAVISGGIEVKGWRKGCDDPRLPAEVRSKVWVADAPMDGNRIVETRQLWADGHKAMRASQFAYGIMERMKAFNTDDESITIPTPKTDLSRARQLEMTVHQRWAIAILRVKEMKDLGNGLTKVWFHQPESQIEFAHPWPQPVIDGDKGSSSFCLTNAAELLDEPGEWFQDYPSGRIYYYPEDGKDPNRMDITVPLLETLMNIGGTRERHVSNIRFENIAFEHSAWRRPLHEGHVTLQGGFRFIDGYKLAEPGLPHKAELENQAWIARPEAAVTAQFADSIGFSSCTFSHIGATAVDLAYAVSSSDISSCVFTDIGGTAIMAGWFGEQGFETHIPYKPAIDSDMCNRLIIARNTITDAANEDWGCGAVSAGYVRDTDISGNTISHVNYSGICVGWGWTAHESGMRNNRITDNSISDYARQLYDVGGIYVMSNQPGSVISGNTISMPYPAPYATNDRAFCIYFDEATDGYTVSNNKMPEESYGYNKPGKNLRIIR
ncbi:right-handed parallel beta-helix repeat-containing protein [uncultured Prevotella sp.]|uniref:right-handed parallel beta-helix repeat-containing protein n=1 Tax=uncultured Prevotella sp. TaxID=159272 RepID=UPI0025E85D2E|nr:right-handed parallel beta-helix repeat-containing protein [uncultured Prevotella sp.]